METDCMSVRSVAEKSKAESDSKFIVASTEGLPQLIERRVKSDRKGTIVFLYLLVALYPFCLSKPFATDDNS